MELPSEHQTDAGDAADVMSALAALTRGLARQAAREAVASLARDDAPSNGDETHVTKESKE